jgi:hypothetical protein
MKSWDTLPSASEIGQVTSLLSYVRFLHTGLGGALSGSQLMAFFIGRRVQPLQHRSSNLWSYAGLEDPDRVAEDIFPKENVDKRVRALTTFTKDHSIADVSAKFFDFEHPVPAVCIFMSNCLFFHSFDLHCISPL